MSNLMGQFEEYTLRAVTEADHAQIERWIAGDQYHASIMDAEYFTGLAMAENGMLATDPRVTVCALDCDGRTLMYIRLTRASRVQIQFAPETESRRSEVAKGLLKGMAFLEVALERAGAMEWIFDTEAPGLKSMATRRLGFAPSPNELVRLIPRLKKEVC